MTVVDGECTGDDVAFCFSFDSKVIEQTVDGVSVVLSAVENENPVAVYMRGIYFDGQDILKFDNLILSTQFTLEFWVRYEGDGSLWSIHDLCQFSLAANYPNIIQESDSIVIDLEVFKNTWTHISYQIEGRTLRSQYRVCLNEANCEDGFLYDRMIIHQYESHVVGTGYVGFIWSICVNQYLKQSFHVSNPSECLANQCVSCPPNECLYECAVNETWDSGTLSCISCESCDLCVHPNKCANCIDELCAECSNYDACDSCLDNAEVVDFEMCECNLHFYQAQENNCDPCPSTCQQCTSSDNLGCIECIDAYVSIQPSNTCAPECPSGYVELNGKCTKSNTAEDSTFKFVFADKPIEQTVNGINLVQTYPYPNEPDLVPVYKRGIYFNGSNAVQLQDLVLNPKFSFTLWIRPNSSNQSLFNL